MTFFATRLAGNMCESEGRRGGIFDEFDGLRNEKAKHFIMESLEKAGIQA